MYSIYSYSFTRANISADAAIVLGAAAWNDKPSPVFRERINHAVRLYTNGKVKYLIFTGGFGKGKKYSESGVAKMYAINNGIPSNSIYIETSSKITLENIMEAKTILKKLNVSTVLIVSDPLHMKRAVLIAKDLNLNAYSSPTTTSMYKSWNTQVNLLFWETYYYIGHLFRRLVM